MQNMNPYQRNFDRDVQDDDDNLYAGYDQIASTDTIHKTITQANNAPAQGAGAAGGSFNPFAPSQQAGPSVRPPTQFFGAGAGGSEPARPMTSVQGAGYRSAKPKWDPLNQSAKTATVDLRDEKKKSSPEETAKAMEREVHALLLASSTAHNKGDHSRALEKGSAAVKKERALTRHRDKHQLGEQVVVELTYSVRFNLARQYHANGMHHEALTAYSQIVKNKQFPPQSQRLRVNMGNIYYEQKRFTAAIKMYRMAMDQISNQTSSSREIRFRIMQNIGSSFVQLGQYQEAIESFDAIMNAYPNTQTGFNLLLCYYARGDDEKMKKAFTALLAVETVGSGSESDDEAPEVPGGIEVPSNAPVDDLKRDQMERRARDERYVHQAAKLIAPVLDPNDFAAGYKWVIAQLLEPARSEGRGSEKPAYPRLAMEMEIALGIAYLKRKDITRAIQVFKDFERKEAALVDQAATNLSFLYFLEGDLKSAEVYAEKAVRADRYNAKALVNKANFMFKNGYLDGAKELYLEAIGVEADCVEAIYNLGLVNKRLGNLKASLMAFSKLHRIVPKDPQVIYQIANLYDTMDEPQSATKWFKILQGAVPTDPTILYRIGALHLKDGDETAAFHNYSDSYNAYPVNMDIISWLGVWYVKSNLYERAIPFFERAAEIEPEEIKWKLMVASCYRRMGALPRALKCYRSIHKQDPDDTECLRYMCSILKDMSRDDEYAKCAELLRKAERASQQEMQQNNRFMQEEVHKDSDLGFQVDEKGDYPDDEEVGGRMITPNASPREGADVWRQPKPQPSVGGGSGFNTKHRGGEEVHIGPMDPPAGSNKPKKKKKKKPKKVAKKEETEDEWGDLDLGMDLLPE